MTAADHYMNSKHKLLFYLKCCIYMIGIQGTASKKWSLPLLPATGTNCWSETQSAR